MVSLKKESREVTPLHLMDEEDAVRLYCPSKDSVDNGIKISLKQADNVQLPAIRDNDNDKPQERTFGGLNKREWAEIIIKSVLIMGVLAIFIFILSGFLGEGLMLVEKIANMNRGVNNDE